MIALHILDIKLFMSHLLIKDTFDQFLLSEASVTTFNTFHIDGHLHRDYFNTEDPDEPLNESCSFWSQVRPFCLDLIKGKRTPLNFKIVFRLSSGNVEKLLIQSGLSLKPEQVDGLFLNLKFDSGRLDCITGTSLRFFTMDKSLEQSWDLMVQKYLNSKELAFELS